MEGLSEPGGINISDVVYQSIRGKIDFAVVDLGDQQLKNIDTPVRVWQWTSDLATLAQGATVKDPATEQQVKFCTSSDGVNIAYAEVGNGPPLVKAPNKVQAGRLNFTRS